MSNINVAISRAKNTLRMAGMHQHVGIVDEKAVPLNDVLLRLNFAIKEIEENKNFHRRASSRRSRRPRPRQPAR